MRELFADSSLASLAQKFLSEQSEGSEPTLSMDRSQYYEILSNPRRRHILRYMKDFEAEGPFEVGFMSTAIAALENEKPVNQVTSGERKKVYVGLYQIHLDRLDDAEVVEYSSDRGKVDFGTKFELVGESVGDRFYEPREEITPEDLK